MSMWGSSHDIAIENIFSCRVCRLSVKKAIVFINTLATFQYKGYLPNRVFFPKPESNRILESSISWNIFIPTPSFSCNRALFPWKRASMSPGTYCFPVLNHLSTWVIWVFMQKEWDFLSTEIAYENIVTIPGLVRVQAWHCPGAVLGEHPLQPRLPRQVAAVCLKFIRVLSSP